MKKKHHYRVSQYNIYKQTEAGNMFSIPVIQKRIIRTGIFGMGRVDITTSREKKTQSFCMNILDSAKMNIE